jgi:hypothetical protein
MIITRICEYETYVNRTVIFDSSKLGTKLIRRLERGNDWIDRKLNNLCKRIGG